MPQKQDEKRRWLAVVIPRANISDKKDTVVCEMLWPPGTREQFTMEKKDLLILSEFSIV